jgi:hypothetical protein
VLEQEVDFVQPEGEHTVQQTKVGFQQAGSIAEDDRSATNLGAFDAAQLGARTPGFHAQIPPQTSPQHIICEPVWIHDRWRHYLGRWRRSHINDGKPIKESETSVENGPRKNDGSKSM